MNKNIKLIWDFRGEEALGMAQHHLLHLNEYAQRAKIDLVVSGADKISELHHIAFIVVKEAEMIVVRDALKPHRAQWHST